MRREWLIVVFYCFCQSETALAGSPKLAPAVVELLEDNGETLLGQMTNPGGDFGLGIVQKEVVFSGKNSVKIIPLQRYGPKLPGWKYRITEKPKPGEYRYLRLAWKGVNNQGIMVQFHDLHNWNLRYTAGQNLYGWASLFVATQVPGEWTVVTCDIYKDFGERTLTGMALTVFGGQAAYFDHIYLGRTIDDLDRIDVTGLRKGKPIERTAAELERNWQDLAASDASKAYLAFWTLVAAAKQSPVFLRKKLLATNERVDLKQIRQWIAELDHDTFSRREVASKHLTLHLEAAAHLLEKELAKPASTEARLRLEGLLALRKRVNPQHVRIDRSIRVLEFIGSPPALGCLAELARGDKGTRGALAAAAALKRVQVSSKK